MDTLVIPAAPDIPAGGTVNVKIMKSLGSFRSAGYAHPPLGVPADMLLAAPDMPVPR